ncbi:DUF2235 domain-containing protein, partial [Planktotalea sp.]|uniref:DUF2235 domain-containing protein n=1 Tax=Planktotalea sp. TaxID=2029877 RepID=UPI00329915F0
VPIYVRGVGTGRGSNAFARTTDKWLGGALGWGLERNIEEAYRRLIWLYEPGDEIFIFGFSRGAYTARSLAGLLRKSGILPRNDIDKVGEAMRLYRMRGDENAPDEGGIQAKRAELSPDVATSLSDLSKRSKPTELLKISYLGIWDTVGAMGLPGFLGVVAKITNKKYAFHDMELSSSVRSAYHAVALDERRKAYPPSLWDNLPELNSRSQRDDEPYQQKWFAGDHGSIGGGGAVRGLSAHTFGWVAKGAQQQHLELNEKALEAVRALCQSADPVNKKKLGFTSKIGFLNADRDGPELAQDVHSSVIDKIRLGVRNAGGVAYRPGSLAKVWDNLPGLLPPKTGQVDASSPLDDEDDETTPQPS